MIYPKDKAHIVEKHGVSMRLYNTKEECSGASVVYQQTDKGHAQEFYHTKCTFVYYIIDGSGTWIIDEEEFPVESGDVVVVTPGKKFYYKGNLKQICITTPAWEAEGEQHVRNVDF